MPTAAVGMVDGKGDAVAILAPEPVPSEPIVAVQAGEIVPASRPEPVSFTIAADDLKTISIKDESPTQKVQEMNGGPPESKMATAAEHSAKESKGNDTILGSATQHEGTLTKIKTGEHSIESKGSLDSGKKSDKTRGLKKIFWEIEELDISPGTKFSLAFG
jgi:hypothetical protein